VGSCGKFVAMRRSSEGSVSRSVSGRCGISRNRSADIARARGDRPRPYTPDPFSSPPSPSVPVFRPSRRRSLSRGSRDLGVSARDNRGAGVRSNSRLSSSPSGWPGCTSSEVVVATNRGHMEDAVQACTGVASNGSRDPSPSTPMSPRSFRRNQQTTLHHPQQELRDRGHQSQEPVCRRRSLPCHSIKAMPIAHLAASDIVRTPRISAPLPAAAVSASPLTDPQPSHMNLSSRFCSPKVQSPQSLEAAVVAATEAVARTLSAARQRGSLPFAEVPKTPDQRPPLDQSSSASLHSRISSPKPQSPRTQGVEQPKVEQPADSVAETAKGAVAAISRAGRISALKSELDLLKSKTGTIRQQLQHFKASQTKLPDEAAEPR